MPRHMKKNTANVAIIILESAIEQIDINAMSLSVRVLIDCRPGVHSSVEAASGVL